MSRFGIQKTSQRTSRAATISLPHALELDFTGMVSTSSLDFGVKYGDDSVIRGEGHTQAHVARIVNDNAESVVRVPEDHLGFSRGWCGNIVMDFVRGSTLAQRKSEGHYKKKDIRAVAAAVRQLTNITIPAGTTPGPVGGGLIGHDFFVDCLSAIPYTTVGDLETQINNVCFPLAFSTSY